MSTEPKSACCKAAMKQGSNDLGDSGTTRYQVCTACGQPCAALAPCPTCGEAAELAKLDDFGIRDVKKFAACVGFIWPENMDLDNHPWWQCFNAAIYRIQEQRAELERLAGVERELGMLRELVGVRADAPACTADAQHWLKMMAKADRVIQAEATTREMRRALDVVEARARVAEAELQTRLTPTAAALLLDRVVQAESALATAYAEHNRLVKQKNDELRKIFAEAVPISDPLNIRGGTAKANQERIEKLRHMANAALALTADDCAEKTEVAPKKSEGVIGVDKKEAGI